MDAEFFVIVGGSYIDKLRFQKNIVKFFQAVEYFQGILKFFVDKQFEITSKFQVIDIEKNSMELKGH